MLATSWLGQRMPFDRLKRRNFITFVGFAAAWPLAARAQQTAMPLVGFLNGLSAGGRPQLVESFRRGDRDRVCCRPERCH
jgi:putative ABC transport system substrate-binding protein